MPPRKPFKCTCDTFLAVLAALIVIAIAGVAIAGIAVPHSREPLQRYCFNKDYGQLLGNIMVDSVENEISWDFQHTPSGIGTIMAIQIIGPTPIGSEDPFTGPIHVALCGIPSMITCDVSTANTVKGSIQQTSPGGMALKTIIQSIRDSPWLYSVRFNTAVEDGEFQSHFTSVCGSK